MDKLFFLQFPEINLASNIFINVPIILQYEDTPLIEVINTQLSTYTTKIPIFDINGIYLAKAVGSRLFKTKERKTRGLSLRYLKKYDYLRIKRQSSI